MRVLVTQVGSLGEQKPFYAYGSEAANYVLVLAASPRRSVTACGRHAVFACTKRSRYVIVKCSLVNSRSRVGPRSPKAACYSLSTSSGDFAIVSRIADEKSRDDKRERERERERE